MDATVARAAEIARVAHHGEVDKAGDDYIDHVGRVAGRLVKFSPEVQAAAWLHDVCEHGWATVEELGSSGFSTEVTTAVAALTREPAEEVDSYLRRVLMSPTSATVKRSDLTDNTRPERLGRLPDAERGRLEGKYAKYLTVLGSFSTAALADLLPVANPSVPAISWAYQDDCDPLAVYHSFRLRHAQAALEQVSDAAAAEPEVTSTLIELTPPSARLYGLEHRLDCWSSGLAAAWSSAGGSHLHTMEYDGIRQLAGGER